jgi:hypothetical protein
MKIDPADATRIVPLGVGATPLLQQPNRPLGNSADFNLAIK